MSSSSQDKSSSSQELGPHPASRSKSSTWREPWDISPAAGLQADRVSAEVPRELGASVYPEPRESRLRAGAIATGFSASSTSLNWCAWLRRRRGRRHRDEELAVLLVVLPGVVLNWVVEIGAAAAAAACASDGSPFLSSLLEKKRDLVISLQRRNLQPVGSLSLCFLLAGVHTAAAAAPCACDDARHPGE